ncbi:MAG: TetR/AcrR family transcriptional regulator [Oscillospiraceae bacterium]|nr:TetR/AcrR family transcriptional regulator [Oscillospiraceae bacterium]
MIKEDRRVRKTKKALREGLAELLTEKNIQQITVRELTDKADVHRSTFYANFKDIYDLYKQMEDMVLLEVSEILSAEYKLDTKVFFGVLFRYIADNKKMCRLILGKHANGTFFNQISGLFKTSCIVCWRREYDLANARDEELEPYAQFFLSGSLGVVGAWVTSDFARPIEELMAMLVELDDTFRKFIKHKFGNTSCILNAQSV